MSTNASCASTTRQLTKQLSILPITFTASTPHLKLEKLNDL